MFGTYKEILSIPGAWKFSVTGFITRFPMSMVSISIILVISTLYNSYSIAGQVAGASIIAYSVAAPWLARLVDRYGQRKIMYPSILFSSANLVLLSVTTMCKGMPELLFLFSILAGAFSGSVGSLVRARWAYIIKKPSRLHTAFALEAAIDEIVFVLGPIIATILTTMVYPVAGLLMAVIMNVVGATLFFSLRDSEPLVVKSKTVVKAKSLMLIPAMFALFIIYLGAGIMFGLIDIVVVGFSEEHGVKSASGVILAMFALGSMISALIYGSRHWMQPLWKRFIIGVILLATGVSTFIFANSLPVLAIVMFITGFAISPTMTNVNNMVQITVSPERLTEGFSWMSTAINIGSSLGAFLGGYLVDYGGSVLGLNFAIIFAWIMVVVSIVSLPILKKSDNKIKLEDN